MIGEPRDKTVIPPGPLGVSVAWGYGFAVLLIVFIMTILVPDADGPSPWDPVAFRKGMIEMIANFRILDELADLSVVKVADVGEGWLIVDLDQIGVSNRRFGSAPFDMALLSAALCLFLRALRLRLLARDFGIPSSVKGQLAAFFYGRGLNLFFPFGPGEFGAIRTLAENGAEMRPAAGAVFYSRVFEILAIHVFLIWGFISLGWGGAVEPLLWTVILIAGVVSLTRPLGRGSDARGRFKFLTNIWVAYRGDALIQVTRELLRTPGFFLGVLTLSIVAFGLEIFAFWSIKQAFSSPMDDYILMKDLTLVPFMIAVAVAGLARVIPYTFASLGIAEFVMVMMFRIFDQGFLSGTTTALLCTLLLNGMTFLFFVSSLWLARCPSVLEVWHQFFAQSAARSEADAVATP
ncbi:MAG: lysylphosphatidylglycerol synthase domain-containing protein [Vicinamibacterales bacterium]